MWVIYVVHALINGAQGYVIGVYATKMRWHMHVIDKYARTSGIDETGSDLRGAKQGKWG